MGLFINLLARRPLDTLLILTTTVCIITRYSAIIIVNQPFGWLYNFPVIVIISFSIIGLFTMAPYLLAIRQGVP
jgi:hypothetical protein